MKLSIKRSLFVSQELNRRIREQHDRLRLLHDTVPKSLHQFMVILIESAVEHLEMEAQKDNLVVNPGRSMSKAELDEVSARLQAIKHHG